MKSALEKALGDHRRSRRGGYDWEDVRGSKTMLPKNWETAPLRQSMRQHGHTRGSEKGYANYRVVNNFLRSRVGQLWSKVYSEFCGKIDKRTYIGSEAAKAINGQVVQNTEIKDGKVVYLGQWQNKWIDLKEDQNTFYVHPVSKVLCYTQKKRYKSTNTNIRFQWREISSRLRVAKINGVWYGFDRTDNTKEIKDDYRLKRNADGTIAKDDKNEPIKILVNQYEEWKTQTDWFEYEKRKFEGSTYWYMAEKRTAKYFKEKRTLSKREKKNYNLD